MKKLLVAAIGAVAACGASAGLISTQRFESVTGELPLQKTISELNTLAGGTFWSGDEITNTYTAVAVSGGLPQDKPLTTPTTALEVKTKFGNPLSLNAIDGGSATNIPASGIYFDSLVKFTVCDDVPEQAYNGAKIIMWLQESEVNNQTTTNIMVRAGYVNSDYTCATNDYVCYQFTGDIEQYHRVTIKTWASIFDGNDVPGFAIFLDGVKVNLASGYAMDSSVKDSLKEATTLIGANAVFPSIVQGNAAGKSTISSVAFDGTGYITDLVFTDEAPFEAAKDYVAPAGTLVVGGVEQDPWYTLDELATTLNSIEAAVQGETTTVEVQLSKDIRFAGPVTINNTDEDVEIIIDLHGCQIVNTASSGYAIICESPVTITDTTEEKLGVIVSDLEAENSGAIYVGEAGALRLEAGTIDGLIDVNAEAADDAVQLAGGTVKQDNITPVDGYKLVARGDFFDVVAIEYFTVTFNSNGGSAVPSATVESGNKVAKPDDPTKAGCVFAGWTLSGNQYDFNTAVTEDITLVAQWTVTWAYYLGDAVDGAYEIDNLAELKAFQANVATNETSDNKSILSTTNLTFKLTADIELDAAWPGIGVQNGKDIYSTETFNGAAFCGTFDGQNHTISGFQMIGKGDKTAGLDYCGFFNSTYGATIQNLKIEYAGSLFAADTTASTQESGATFVGVAKNSTLRNLTTVAGTVSCSKGFGGIVGYLTSGTLVDSCTNNVNMTSLAKNKCGGIAMIAQGGSAVTIQNCQNNGTQTTGSSNSEYGAIVGYVGLDITIANCETTVGRFLKHQGNTVTLQGVNKGDATVAAYHGTATPGLNFATVDNGVATFVANDALALNGEYKVMATNVTATFAFAEAGTIAFDQALFTPTNYAITAAQGLTLTDATSGTVKTYTAAAAVTPIEPGQSSKSYATEEAAEAAAASMEIGVPTAVAKALSTEAQATYKAMFQKNVVSDGAGGYKVEVAMKADVVAATQTQADADAAEVVEDLTEANVTLTTTPGLYYSFEYGTSLENMTEGARTMATGSSLELARPTTENATSGFYKVLVNVSDK